MAVTTLYIGNLPWSVHDQDLANWVAPHATVKGARIIIEKESGRSKGFGFVEVSADDAEKAIQALNGATLGGRVVTVNVAQSRQRSGV